MASNKELLLEANQLDLYRKTKTKGQYSYPAGLDPKRLAVVVCYNSYKSEG